MAEKPCALSVNGIYLGVVDGFERSTELNPEDGVFCELKPNGFHSVRFHFDEEFLFSPPPQIKLYYTGDAVAVYACDFIRTDQSLNVLWQKRLGGTLLTLTLQGKVTLNLENETGLHMINLPDAFETCTAKSHGKFFLLESETAFALLSHDGKIAILSEGTVLDTKDGLKAEVPFHDSVGHTAVCTYREGELKECSIRAKREPTEATFALALFESALIGADCTPYMSEALQEKANSLKEFLGEFLSVVLTEEPDKVGLIYERKERVYDVRYFRVETTDGKVSNIKEE
ncbi:MAG: hypothetical protein K2N74_01385 [Clostridiales bacterium]|nr:hypothetical protein [Clostridiales bacterium]